MAEGGVYSADKAAELNHKEYIRCRDNGHRNYLEEAVKNDQFFRGEQWDAADLATLREEGRPALTINKILSTINTVCGEQRLTRADFSFKGAGDGLDNSAFALTKLANAVAEANRFDFLESEVFADGIIENRGYFDVRIDSSSGQAKVKITRANNRHVIIDNDADDYDPETWRQVMTTKFLSLDDIESEYGSDKVARLKHLIYDHDEYLADSVKFTRQTFGDEGDNGDILPAFDNVDELASAIKAIRVIERQHARYVKQFAIVDPVSGKSRELALKMTKQEAETLSQRLGVHLVHKTTRKIRWTVSADRVTLHDDWSPYRSFTIIPYFPIFRRGRALGLVTNLRSPQEQVNKLKSQELHIVNSTANSGYTVEKGSLANMTVEELATKGSKTGVVIEYNPGRRPPEKIQSNSIPTGIDRITQMAAFDIKEISGVNDSMLGMETAQVSGVALEKKRAGGMTQMQVPMDNLAHTRWMVARKLLELFQDFYTDERVVNFTDVTAPSQQDQVAINQVQDDGSVENDITYGDYNIVISTAPARDTYNDTQLAEAINLRAAGIMVPDHHVISYTNLADKQVIAEQVKQLNGFGEPSEEEQELAAMQQRVSVEMMLGELDKLRAEISKLESEALKVRAEAEDAMSNKELEKLEAEIQIKREEFALRKDLAMLSAFNKLDSLELNNRGQAERTMLQALANNQQKTNGEPPHAQRH